MVRAEGLEPPCLTAVEPKSTASTSSATPAAAPKAARERPAALPLQAPLYSNGAGPMQQKNANPTALAYIWATNPLPRLESKQ